ncbi:MAG: hypothetical protein NTX86_04650 [Candidatus Dependentiae bacterium]|nr:hypothetical protein [Candidatus Dependentiae bacterium]
MGFEGDWYNKRIIYAIIGIITFTQLCPMTPPPEKSSAATPTINRLMSQTPPPRPSVSFGRPADEKSATHEKLTAHGDLDERKSPDTPLEKKATSWYETYRIVKSAAFFYPSRVYTCLKNGGDAFTFHQITEALTAQDTCTHGVFVERDANGAIVRISDGKKPIILSSIPSCAQNIQKLKKTFALADDATIGVYTLNREFERSWSGLAALAKADPSLATFQYPTIDYGAPSFEDILRAVRDLELRVLYEHELALVHCKAGRGRSAVIVAAALINICHKGGINGTPEAIEAFLCLKRPQVSLNSEHKEALSEFYTKLKQAGSFDALYEANQDSIEKRDTELEAERA